VLVLFFSYGHIYDFLEKNLPNLGRHRFLLPAWLAIAVVGIWLIARRVKNPSTFTRALNLTALVALVIPVYQVINWEVLQANAGPVVKIQGTSELKVDPNATPRDVYFILVDEYARKDVLGEVYNYDNTPFLDTLRSMGFQVVDCSQSNYAQTELALSSILNMDYLDKLGEFNASTKGTSEVRHLVQDNSVMQAFKRMGYKLVTFATGYAFSEFHYADYYLTPNSGNDTRFGRMNIFEVMLFKTTLGLALSDISQVIPSLTVAETNQPLDTKREQILYDLERLERMPLGIAGPKFVFAHILSLHSPYVFSRDGQPAQYPENMSASQNYSAYTDQLEYTNQRLISVLQAIIQDSDPKPIIILQGDTGPGLVSHSGRMSNLSAFYLPDDTEQISPSMTPVNDFRLVFDKYFGANLDLLPDTSYFSPYTAPFVFETIPNTCITSQGQ
jgi:hypothetical protein